MSDDASDEEKKSDLGPRLVTAGVAIPILLYLVFPAPKWAFLLLVLWAAGTSVWEYCNIVYGRQMPKTRWVVAALGVAVCAALFWAPDFFLAALAGATLLTFLYFLFAYREQESATLQIGSSVTALVYGAVLLGTVGLLHRDAGAAGGYWVLLLMSIVWLSDTGAYFSGRAFGKRKLYEAVSPNKSVEGALGGFVVSVGAAVGLNYLFGADAFNGTFAVFGADWLTMEVAWEPLGAWQILLVAVPANVLGQCGDLAESLVKRAHGVKDSGTIIYGHGGILDRIDALIFAAPWIYICFSRLA